MGAYSRGSLFERGGLFEDLRYVETGKQPVMCSFSNYSFFIYILEYSTIQINHALVFFNDFHRTIYHNSNSFLPFLPIENHTKSGKMMTFAAGFMKSEWVNMHRP